MAARCVFPALPVAVVLDFVVASAAVGCGSVWPGCLCFCGAGGCWVDDAGMDLGVTLLESLSGSGDLPVVDVPFVLPLFPGAADA